MNYKDGMKFDKNWKLESVYYFDDGSLKQAGFIDYEGEEIKGIFTVKYDEKTGFLDEDYYLHVRESIVDAKENPRKFLQEMSTTKYNSYIKLSVEDEITIQEMCKDFKEGMK